MKTFWKSASFYLQIIVDILCDWSTVKFGACSVAFTKKSQFVQSKAALIDVEAHRDLLCLSMQFENQVWDISDWDWRCFEWWACGFGWARAELEKLLWKVVKSIVLCVISRSLPQSTWIEAFAAHFCGRVCNSVLVEWSPVRKMLALVEFMIFRDVAIVPSRSTFMISNVLWFSVHEVVQGNGLKENGCSPCLAWREKCCIDNPIMWKVSKEDDLVLDVFTMILSALKVFLSVDNYKRFLKCEI